jgi:hypothetical protein
VYTDELGQPLRGYNVNKAFGRLLRDAGLPHTAFYSLRHSAATAMLATGVPLRVVADVLGHITIVITANNLYRGRTAAALRGSGRDGPGGGPMTGQPRQHEIGEMARFGHDNNRRVARLIQSLRHAGAPEDSQEYWIAALLHLDEAGSRVHIPRTRPGHAMGRAAPRPSAWGRPLSSTTWCEPMAT